MRWLTRESLGAAGDGEIREHAAPECEACEAAGRRHSSVRAPKRVDQLHLGIVPHMFGQHDQ